jgi:hypothetical protein
VAGEVFAGHFARLFGKESEEQLLHLSEQAVGQAPAKCREDLAGLPTVAKVRRAITGLNLGKAPGSNGLRAELFKLAKGDLAHRLVQDLALIWLQAVGGR